MLETASFFSFSGYEGFERFLLSLPRAAGAAAKVFPIGESVEGRAIYCLRLGGAADAPGVLYVSLVHGMEFIGGDMNLAIIRWFLRDGDRAAVEKIFSRRRIYLVPAANPDAYERAVRQRETFGAAFARKNARGVDLNRNYPVGFDARGGGLWAGTSFRLAPVYRGPHPFSEPEALAIKCLAESEPIKTSLSFHSFGRTIGYPWCHKKERAPDHGILRRVALGMRARQKKVKYRVMQEYDYVPTSGDMNDWLYEELGVLPFIMEIGRLGFRPEEPGTWFDPFAWTNMPNADKEIENNLHAVLYLAEWTAENL